MVAWFVMLAILFVYCVRRSLVRVPDMQQEQLEARSTTCSLTGLECFSAWFSELSPESSSSQSSFPTKFYPQSVYAYTVYTRFASKPYSSVNHLSDFSYVLWSMARIAIVRTFAIKRSSKAIKWATARWLHLELPLHAQMLCRKHVQIDFHKVRSAKIVLDAFLAYNHFISVVFYESTRFLTHKFVQHLIP